MTRVFNPGIPDPGIPKDNYCSGIKSRDLVLITY